MNIGSGNGLVPLSNKPLPESMLAQIYIAIMYDMNIMDIKRHVREVGVKKLCDTWVLLIGPWGVKVSFSNSLYRIAARASPMKLLSSE